MSDDGVQPASVGQAADAVLPPAPSAASVPYGAPAPPPPPPHSTYGAPRRRRPVRTVGGILGVLVVIGVKLFAFAGVSHLLHGASPVVIIVVLIALSILFRPLLRRFLGR